MEDEARLARALGWFSIGLGTAEVFAPEKVAQLIGVRENQTNRGWLMICGLREITAGVGILTQKEPKGWLWARVAGDAMDLTLLLTAFNSNNATERQKTLSAIASVVGITAVDVITSQLLTNKSNVTNNKAQEKKTMQVKKSITVNRPIEEVYQFWHNFENLPRFMRHLEAVQVKGDRRSHWKAKAPAGLSVEWDAEVTTDTPNRLIAWRSMDGASVSNSGQVEFKPAPGNRGTEVLVNMQYDAPGGALGAAVAKLLGEEPSGQVYDDLRSFKQILEVGEIVVSDSSIHEKPHPAQPPQEIPQTKTAEIAQTAAYGQPQSNTGAEFQAQH